MTGRSDCCMTGKRDWKQIEEEAAAVEAPQQQQQLAEVKMEEQVCFVDSHSYTCD